MRLLPKKIFLEKIYLDFLYLYLGLVPFLEPVYELQQVIDAFDPLNKPKKDVGLLPITKKIVS